MSRLEIAFLGPPEIRADGNLVKSDRRKAVALLAYLAVTHSSHPRDHLSGLLWPDYERDSAYAYLRRTLWELNKMLGKGWIEADREHASLDWDRDIWLDVSEFRDAIRAQPEDQDSLIHAIDLYRGDFLTGFMVADTDTFEEWQFQQADDLRRDFSRALEELIEVYDQSGEFETALPFARRWLGLDPLNESAHRSIMQLLARMGDRTGAIRQYEACAKILKDELGILPQPETNDLYEAVLRGESPGRQPPAKSSHRSLSDQQLGTQPAIHLPVMPTPFIGRRPEVDQVKALISNPDIRLVTLTGPGGTGKTRLSIQAASELGVSFPDGVFFVGLATVGTTDELIPAVAKAVQLTFFRDENRRQQLLDYLGERNLLLVLDNFEHLLEASALLNEIIASAPGVKLLVTSRIQLNLLGEQLFPVSGMHIPGPAEESGWHDPEELVREYSGVQLFLDRARRVRPEFEVGKKNATPVLKICRLVQGMPLALELAAAWIELLPPEEIAAEIHKSLDFLETDWADIPDRQHSLRAVFDSSWLMLSKDEQEIFLSLCVFVGSFSREAAQSVSRSSLRTLLGLANKSFLQQTDSGRFQLHELMRQFGEERLKADELAWNKVKNRHADYFASYVNQQAFRMRGPEQLAGLIAMIEEFDGNIKNAWDWLLSQRRWSDLLQYMTLGLFHFGSIRWQNDELIPWFKAARVSSVYESRPEEMLNAVIFGTLEVYCEETSGIHDAGPSERLGSIWRIAIQEDLVEAMDFWFIMLAGLVKARNLAPDVDELLDASLDRLRLKSMPWLLGIGLLFKANWLSDFATDEASLLEAGKIFQDLGVIFEQGVVAESLGVYAYKHRRPLSEITAHYNRARHYYEQFKGYSSNIGTNLHGQAEIYFLQGKYKDAFALFKEEQNEMERMGQKRLLRYSKHWESLFASRYSNFETALQLRQECLELTKIYGSQSDLAWQLFELGDIYRIFGEPETALGYYDQAWPMFAKMKMNLGLGFDQRARGDLALADERYSEALSHFHQYNKYVIEDQHHWAMPQALARIALANAYRGNIDEARYYMQNALALSAEFPYDDLAFQTLLAEPVCRLREGNPAGAVEIVSFIQRQPGSWNETKQHARKIQETASRDLKRTEIIAAVERSKTLDLETVVSGSPIGK